MIGSHNKILQKGFWSAFRSGIYPEKSEIKSDELSKWIYVAEGLCYAKTFSYPIKNIDLNIIAIEKSFYISIHDDENNKNLGWIGYNPRNKKFQMRYWWYLDERFPQTISLLHKVKDELMTGYYKPLSIQLDEKEVKGGFLAYEGPIKFIIINTKWRSLLSKKSNKTPQEICNYFSKNLEIEPITVSGLYGAKSIYKDVKIQASHARAQIIDHKYKITQRWLKFRKENPKMEPEIIAEKISTVINKLYKSHDSRIKNVNPTTVAAFARSSVDSTVSGEAIQVYKSLGEKNHNITQRYKEIKKENPELKPIDIFNMIAKERGIESLTIAVYASASKDKEIKSIANKTTNQLRDLNHNITKQWKNMIQNYPKLTSRQITEKIAINEKLTPVGVASLARFSSDPLIKRAGIKLYGILLEEKNDIGRRWLEIKKKYPNIKPENIAQLIAEDLSLSPLTIAGYGSYSNHSIVSFEARKAGKVLTEQMHNITERWINIKKNNSHLLPFEIAELIAKEDKISATSISSNAAASNNSIVKNEAIKSLFVLFEKKYGITGRFLMVRSEEPELSPKEIFIKIADNLGINPSAATTYGKFSSNKEVKKEAGRLYSQFQSDRLDIGEKWKSIESSNKNTSPKEIIDKIAKIYNLSPFTIAGISMTGTQNPKIRKESAKVYKLLTEEKYHISDTWKSLIKTNQNSSLMERIEELKKILKLKKTIIIFYGKMSKDHLVRKEARELLYIFNEKKFKIIENWNQMKKLESNITSIEIAEKIAAKFEVKPITIANAGRTCSNSDIKKNMGLVYNLIMEKKYKISESWIEVKKENSKYSPMQIAEHIAMLNNVSPSTIAGYGRVSENPKVKTEAGIAYNKIINKNHNLEKKWKEKRLKYPKLHPEEIARKIALEVSLNPISVSSYARSSSDLSIKREAEISLSKLVSEKHNINEIWKEMIQNKINLQPHERAMEIAKRINVKPATVSYYGIFSDDYRVKKEALKSLQFFRRNKKY